MLEMIFVFGCMERSDILREMMKKRQCTEDFLVI